MSDSPPLPHGVQAYRAICRIAIGFKKESTVDLALIGSLSNTVVVFIILPIRVLSATLDDTEAAVYFYQAFILCVTFLLLTTVLSSLPRIAHLSRKFGVLLIAVEEMLKAIVTFICFILFIITIAGVCVFGLFKVGVG